MPKLTKRIVEGTPPTDRDVLRWDSAVSGFGVRVWPSGRRVYVVQYRTREGQQRKRVLGQHGTLTVEQARTMARQWLGNVRQGTDPVDAYEATRKAPTVAELAARYMAEHATVKKKPGSIRPDAYNLRCHVLPALGKKKVAMVTRADIAALHHTMHKTPGAANRVLALLSKMFTLAEQWGLRPEGSNPVRYIERYRERRFERFLSSAELARLGETLAEAERTQTEYPSALAAIRLLIFTGARLAEILELRWDQVDFERVCLRLPDSKSGAKLIHLSPPALDVLSGIAQPASNPYVIVGREPYAHLVNLRKPWGRLRARAGLPDVRLHDLRHSFASVGAALGVSLPIIGKILGHTQAATTQRYTHLAADPVQDAVHKIGVTIAAAMQGHHRTQPLSGLHREQHALPRRGSRDHRR
jgi:integrase